MPAKVKSPKADALKAAPATVAQDGVESASAPQTEQTDVNLSGIEQPAAQEVTLLTQFLVSAHVDGFRRCGRSWSRQQISVSADEFSESEILALMNEPMLDVIGVSKPL